MSPEFELIARHFSRHGIDPAAGVLLGVGDDCALLDLRQGNALAVSTDTLVADVHFFADAAPSFLGHKALAVNLSDLAAMGAEPRWFTLALTIPAIDQAWLEAFASGLFALADSANIRLVGGDTTRGPLSFTLTVMGEVPTALALRRDGAKLNDEIWVSGTLGDAALGLAIKQNEVIASDEHRRFALDRLQRPSARTALGLALRGLATAAIDVSDGLLSDLGHIGERSGLGATIRQELIPMSAAVRAVAGDANRLRFALSGGDDYELCFTAPPHARADLSRLAEKLALPLTCIGSMRTGEGVSVLDAAGRCLVVSSSGYDHFSAGSGG